MHPMVLWGGMNNACRVNQGYAILSSDWTMEKISYSRVGATVAR